MGRVHGRASQLIGALGAAALRLRDGVPYSGVGCYPLLANPQGLLLRVFWVEPAPKKPSHVCCSKDAVSGMTAFGAQSGRPT